MQQKCRLVDDAYATINETLTPSVTGPPGHQLLISPPRPQLLLLGPPCLYLLSPLLVGWPRVLSDSYSSTI